MCVLVTPPFHPYRYGLWNTVPERPTSRGINQSPARVRGYSQIWGEKSGRPFDLEGPNRTSCIIGPHICQCRQNRALYAFAHYCRVLIPPGSTGERAAGEKTRIEESDLGPGCTLPPLATVPRVLYLVDFAQRVCAVPEYKVRKSDAKLGYIL